jgi:hypothetical protein
MGRNRAHLLVNLLSYLVFLGLASTGFLMAYRLPPGTCTDSMLGFTRHEWGDFHFYLSLGFVGLLVVHLLLNWKWVTGSLAGLVSGMNPDGSPRGIGGAICLLLLGAVTAVLLAGPWLLNVEGRGKGGGRRGGAGEPVAPVRTSK